jgi:hypothetical protein
LDCLLQIEEAAQLMLFGPAIVIVVPIGTAESKKPPLRIFFQVGS